ncbi:MAG: hypothetical protein EXR72_18320 [Myxococcales bacterium]|nr:hypothetical protein [Myxococcales bacterium]
MREPPQSGLDRHVLFLDRNLGHGPVAAALRERGARVEEHDQNFARDAPDAVWLPEVGRREWAVVTQDDRIRYRVAERTAAANAGVALFIFTGRKMRGPAIGAALVVALPRMLRVLDKQHRPFIAKVTRSGHVEVLAG